MSLAARIADMVGDELESLPEVSVEAALAGCPRGGVCRARAADGEAVAVAVFGDGRAYAVPDRCPHHGARLSDGFVDGERLVCAHHGWEIDLPTGEVVGMARPPVPSRRIA